MIINFRYHVFTITAIFAALGIGILIGSSIIGNEGLLEEQRRIVKNISEDINRLKEENTQLLESIHLLEKDLLYKKDIEQKVYPLLLKDLMEEKRFCLFYNNVTDKQLEELAYYFGLMDVDYNILNYAKEDEQEKFSNLSSFNYFISWNIDKPLNEFMKVSVEELKNYPIFNYQGEDVQGLIINIIKDVLDDQR